MSWEYPSDLVPGDEIKTEWVYAINIKHVDPDLAFDDIRKISLKSLSISGLYYKVLLQTKGCSNCKSKKCRVVEEKVSINDLNVPRNRMIFLDTYYDEGICNPYCGNENLNNRNYIRGTKLVRYAKDPMPNLIIKRTMEISGWVFPDE